jgi:pyrroloquinoline-quinone synthase
MTKADGLPFLPLEFVMRPELSLPELSLPELSLSTLSLRDRLSTVLAAKPLLDHPFNRAWVEGRLNRDQIKHYVVQYFFVSASFPDDLALLDRFAKALGATSADLVNTVPLGTTEQFASQLSQNLQASELIKLASLASYQGAWATIAAHHIEALRRFYGMTQPAEYQFLRVHPTLNHPQLDEAIAQPPPNSTASAQLEAMAAAERLMDAYWQFLDGIYITFCAALQSQT